MDIGKILKEARDKKGLTQQELAKMLHVTDRAISNWENSKRIPDYSVIYDLCDKLDININDLFDPEGEIKRYYKNKVNKEIYAFNVILLVMFILTLVKFNYIYIGVILFTLFIYAYILISIRNIDKYDKTIGTIDEIKHLHFIKINKKMFRTHLYKDSYFPLYVKIKYNINGIEYLRSKIIFKEMNLKKGSKIYIIYDRNNPNSVKIL